MGGVELRPVLALGEEITARWKDNEWLRALGPVGGDRTILLGGDEVQMSQTEIQEEAFLEPLHCTITPRNVEQSKVMRDLNVFGH